MLTKHFLKRADDPKTKFPGRTFYRKFARFAELSQANIGRQCMVRLKDCKIVFMPCLEKDEHSIRLVFITVMPHDYKHNIFKRAKTENLGVMWD